ncbi:hypothetical protein D3C71_1688690 [compost metagenome]
MPHSFRPFTSRSFGHLMPASTPVSRRMAEQTAAPASSVSCGVSWSGIDGRSTTLIQMPLPLGECHLRPCLPLPPVCSSAITAVPSGAPCSASSFAASCVDTTVSTRRRMAAQPEGRRSSASSPGKKVFSYLLT